MYIEPGFEITARLVSGNRIIRFLASHVFSNPLEVAVYDGNEIFSDQVSACNPLGFNSPLFLSEQLPLNVLRDYPRTLNSLFLLCSNTTLATLLLHATHVSGA
ncbi:hypothetical protein [Desulfonatronum parangueonense]